MRIAYRSALRVVGTTLVAGMMALLASSSCGGTTAPGIADASSNASSSSGSTSSSSSSSSGSTSGGGSTSSSSSSGSSGATKDSGTTGSYVACKQASDCEFGEIDHEILTSADCVCLFGCPHIPLSKDTVNRRADQFKKLCDPRKNGNGDPCPIDDCAGPGPIVCRNNVCSAPAPGEDAGNGM